MTDNSQDSTITLKDRAESEWAQGWKIVVASFVGIALCLSPLPYWALIVIGEKLGEEFGWKREVINAGFLFMTAGVMIGAPIAGQLVDKFGARKVLLPSLIALSIGTMSFSLMTANPVVFYTIFFMTAFFGSATLPVTWSKAIVNNFDKHRGLALGIALTGTGVYGFLASPTIQFIIERAGWRWAYVSVGILPLVLSFPLALKIFRDHKEETALSVAEAPGNQLKTFALGAGMALSLFTVMTWMLLEKGPVWAVGLMAIFLFVYVLVVYIGSGRKGQVENPLPGFTLRETFHDYRFWMVFFAFLILGAVVSGTIANSKFILLDKGYTATQATGFFTGTGIIGLSVIGGRLLGGYLVDHFWAPLVGFVFSIAPAFGCYILIQDHGMAVNALALVLVGLAAGVEFDLMAYFVSRYFGMKSYGRIYGIFYAGFGLGAGTSPIIFVLIKGDDTDYGRVFALAIWGFVIGSTMLLTLGKYRDFTSGPVR